MSAAPSLFATLPDTVFMALVQADTFTTSAPVGLALAWNVLSEMRDAAGAEKPIDPNTVATWREQLAWLINHIEDDLDALAAAVRDTGVTARLR